MCPFLISSGPFVPPTPRKSESGTSESVTDPRAFFSSEKVVEILRSLPDLEVLQLHTFISHNETSSIQPVSLPHLRHLGLISSIDIPNDGMKVLFDKLDICPDACVHLILPINLVPNLPPHFTSDLRTSEISVSMPHGFVKMDIQAVRSNSSLKYSTAHIQASHAQIFGPPPGKKMVLTILLSVLRRSTWSRPSSCLRVDFSQCSGGQPTAEDWSSVFECLPTLESMEVQLACSHGGFRSLTEPPWNPQTSGEMGEIEAASLLISVLSEQAVCPKLRRLVFPAIDRSQLTEKFSGTVKAFMEGRESRGLPYLDIILGELPASDA
ncbi:hypothetical protein BD410DRAFT_509273 [Rickenella mellea]|uniref:F-box domain-containing protein n=1 Tax=Rickenella mellea TaxID=50990 RepID=A0A4Y7PRP7_9AGAM|nr:hypothetical protein BD410DRAFT_509273 [Rickenella mellea]